MTQLLGLNDIIEGGFDYREYISYSDSSNTESLIKMVRFLKNAIRDELTDQQRVCLQMSVFEGFSQREIAENLGLNASTVCRHIAAAKRKLRHVAQYYRQ